MKVNPALLGLVRQAVRSVYRHDPFQLARGGIDIKKARCEASFFCEQRGLLIAVREQGQEASALDGSGQLTLPLGRGAGNATG